MNTTLTEYTTDEIEELRKDYYDEYYPSPRIEKAVFNYLDQDYYAGRDNVFFSIYKKENDWFVNQKDIEEEITKMFGLTLPERIKIGPGEDDYIEPARNPIPGRVIHKWIVHHQKIYDKEEHSKAKQAPPLGDGPSQVEEQKTSDDDKERVAKLNAIKAQITTNDSRIKNLEKQIKDLEDKDSEVTYFGDKTKDKPKATVIGILEVGNETQLSRDVMSSEIKALQSIINSYKAENNYLNNQKKDLNTPKPIKTDSTKAMDADKDVETTDTGNTSTQGTKKPIKISKIIDKDGVLGQMGVTEQEESDIDDAEDNYDNEDYVDNTPFTRTEALILKTLHRDLSKEELFGISEETPAQWSPVDKKFWGIMKLFGMDYSSGGPEDNVMVSRYAKWAYDNWTEEGDYANIEKPIKVPLKWYDIEVDETGSQVEYKSGEAQVMGYDEDDATDRALDDFYSWGGELETNDYGDYERYDSEATRIDFLRLAEQFDPAIKYNIDQQYRTDPELRDEILKSLEDELEGGKGYEGDYHLNPESDSPALDIPPIKIAQKFSDVNGYGNIKFDMQGGNGIAYFTDKDLVIKLTADESEYFTANKLVGTDNEYIVKVIESAKIKTSHTSLPIFVIVEEALPMTEEMEQKWSQCCCGVDSPIHIDYLEEPALVLPPVSEHDKCLSIYDNIIGIQKNFAEYGIVWNDIGIDNMGIKNGKLAVVDLGETRVERSVEGKTVTLEHINIRPLTTKQIKKQLVLI